MEALALGRNGIGIDISQLAEFVTMVKTTIMSDDEIATLEEWIGVLAKSFMLVIRRRTLATMPSAAITNT